MNKNKTYIYGLFDKDYPDILRYIGKSDNPENRTKRHIQNSKYAIKNNKTLTHKDRWLNKINYNISFIILEECDKSIWQERECYYINQNKNLTNTSKGGLGGSGIKYNKSYKEIKLWVKENINITSKSKWYNYIKNNNLPDFIPTNPREVYLNRGWISWGDFLGTGKKWDNYVNYLTYLESKKIIQTLKINTCSEYKIFSKQNLIPKNIPKKPDRYYKNRGWVSWGDFLGTGRIANKLKK